MGTGALTDAALAAAVRVSHRVFGGVHPTIGIAGGYTPGGYSLGGGHSPLTPLHGLGADNVLKLDVMLANSMRVRAAPDVNPDLYWALCDGGGGT
jgi:FAD/FMN-containing dehydrogenase